MIKKVSFDKEYYLDDVNESEFKIYIEDINEQQTEIQSKISNDNNKVEEIKDVSEVDQYKPAIIVCGVDQFDQLLEKPILIKIKMEHQQ